MRGTTNGDQSALYALPSRIEPLDAVRGTILALDWRVLRELGIFDAYTAAMQRGQRDTLLSTIAGSWVPLALMQLHYRALDALALDDERIRLVGFRVGDGVHGAVIKTLVRLAGSLGVTPWLALEQSYKLWVRSWRGGAIVVHRLASQAARVSLLETGVCSSPFFRTSFAGALCAGIAPFCKTRNAVEISGTQSASTVAYLVTWT